MRRSPLEEVLESTSRMDVLCCLLDHGPRAMSDVSIETGEPIKAVRYWVRSLESFGLVEELADHDGGEPLHVATLDERPDWVRCVIEHSRARRRLDSE